METVLNYRSAKRPKKRLLNVRAALLSAVLLVALAGIACAGSDEEATAVPTSPPQATTAPATAPDPTPAGDTTSDETGTGSLQVRVTDAPGDATAVLVTVSSVQVNVQDAEDDSDSWITVVEGPVTFDLVELDGVEAVLGESDLAVGKYGQIRLEVGEVELRIPGGTFITARVPSGTLKLVGGFEIKAGAVTGVTIDFDLDRSLVEQGNGGFLFKPVVKLITSAPGETLDAPVPLIPEAGEADDSEEPTPEPSPSPVPESTATEVPESTATPAPATATPEPTATQSPVGEFFLAIETPESLEAVTAEAEFEVVGRTSLDAIVSVNDTIAVLDINGRFRVTVTLDEDVNVIEVVASVASGEELSEVLVIIRE